MITHHTIALTFEVGTDAAGETATAERLSAAITKYLADTHKIPVLHTSYEVVEYKRIVKRTTKEK